MRLLLCISIGCFLMAFAGASGVDARPFTKVECYQEGLIISPETKIRTVEVNLCDACGVELKGMCLVWDTRDNSHG